MAGKYRSAINAALDNVKAGQKAAKEIIEGSSKSANKQAAMIKNCVNTVQSNLGNGQAKVIANLGEDSGRALKEGVQNAVKQVDVKPVSKVLEDSANKGQSSARAAYEAVNNKRVNKVIDGHNAQARQTNMDTIVNNVKDGNINRNPQNGRRLKEHIDQSVENIKGGRTAEAINTVDMSQPQNRMPITSFGSPVGSSPQASQIIKNGPKKPTPTTFNETPNTKQITYNIDVPTINMEEMNASLNKIIKDMNADNAKFVEQFNDVKGKAKDTFLGGAIDTYQGYKNGQGIVDSFVNAHKNEDGSLNIRRAAGTFMTASAAARVASGGGIYKDRYGNPNLIGLPFI